jgi:hypothetical protein
MSIDGYSANYSPAPLTPEQEKAKKDREYRDKRLTIAAIIYSGVKGMSTNCAVDTADFLIAENERKPVP